MRSHRMMLAASIAASVVGLEMVYGRPSNPSHWGDDQARRAASEAQSEADAARLAAAQAKRNRKNAKRLRDARRIGDA